METIKEEDDTEIKMYERESMQINVNLKLDEINKNQNERESNDNNNNNENNEYRESKTFQDRYTALNDSIFNAIDNYQEEEQKDLNNNNEVNNNQENDNNENINNQDGNININEIEDKDNNQNNIKIIPKTKTEKLQEYKINVLGDFGVGKSSLIYRYLNNKFKKDIEENNIKPENNIKIIQIDDNTKIKLNIWDTAGQEKSGKIIKQYYRDSYGALIVFDLTNKQSFDNIKKWIKELKENSPKDIVYCYGGNKSDLIEERTVSYEEIKEFLQDNLYYEISSKTGNNVSLAFEQLAYNIIEKQNEEKGNPDKVIRGTEGRKTMDLKDGYNEDDLKVKKGCC